MKSLKKYTTSQGNKLEFFKLSETDILVHDSSCQMEKVYTIGKNQILYFEDYDEEPEQRTLITSFKQVIDVWTEEKIHF